jgi:hypothetical protein
MSFIFATQPPCYSASACFEQLEKSGLTPDASGL